MKLFISPGSCSLSPHIVASELGIHLELVKTDLRAKKTETGEDFTKISVKGQVPALELDNGEVLTEGVAIVQYLDSLHPEKGLIPKNGMERFRQLELLNFISTEIHKGYSPLFNPENTEEFKEKVRANLSRKFQLLEEKLTRTSYLMGENFTVADAYLFTCLRWSKNVKLELPGFLSAFVDRVAARSAVAAALKKEGLI